MSCGAGTYKVNLKHVVIAMIILFYFILKIHFRLSWMAIMFSLSRGRYHRRWSSTEENLFFRDFELEKHAEFKAIKVFLKI